MINPTPPTEEHVRFGMDEKQWVAFTSVVAAIVLTITKLVVGLWTNSLGILSEALHSALDLFAAGITLYAVRKAAQPPDSDHHYGHWRVENLSALTETILLLITVIWIIYEALRRIIFQDLVVEVNLLAFGVVIFAIIIDYSRSRALKRVAKKYDSQALQADALHFSTDILSSSVVLIGLVFTFLGFPLGDPLAAIGVAFVVLYITFKLGRETIDILLDRAPSELVTPIQQAIEQIEGIKDCSRVRLRKAGPITFVDIVCHVEPALSHAVAHDISVKARKTAEQIVGRADVVVHMDLATKQHPELVHNLRGEAKKFPWIIDVHGIEVFNTEGQNMLVLDLEVDPEMSLAEAHQLIEKFEAHIKSEFSFVDEITTHLEPRKTPSPPVEDLSAIEARIRSLIQKNPVLHNCHDLQLIPQSPKLYNLTFHCEARPKHTIEEIHTATTLLEDEIRETLPLFSQIIIHTEPLTEKATKKPKKKPSP
ncbi:MAG: cation diffusion facilitator family transporter [Candidatus Thorarchaeota archaeon]